MCCGCWPSSALAMLVFGVFPWRVRAQDVDRREPAGQGLPAAGAEVQRQAGLLRQEVRQASIAAAASARAASRWSTPRWGRCRSRRCAAPTSSMASPTSAARRRRAEPGSAASVATGTPQRGGMEMDERVFGELTKRIAAAPSRRGMVRAWRGPAARRGHLTRPAPAAPAPEAAQDVGEEFICRPRKFPCGRQAECCARKCVNGTFLGQRRRSAAGGKKGNTASRGSARSCCSASATARASAQVTPARKRVETTSEGSEGHEDRWLATRWSGRSGSGLGLAVVDARPGRTKRREGGHHPGAHRGADHLLDGGAAGTKAELIAYGEAVRENNE